MSLVAGSWSRTDILSLSNCSWRGGVGVGISMLSECMLLALARDELDGTLKDWITLWIPHSYETRQKSWFDLFALHFASEDAMETP